MKWQVEPPALSGFIQPVLGAIAEVPRAPGTLEGRRIDVFHLTPVPTGWEDMAREHVGGRRLQAHLGLLLQT